MYVTDLMIKKRLSNQQEDDVQGILENSNDGYMVFRIPKLSPEELLSPLFVPAIQYSNKKMGEILGHSLATKESIQTALTEPSFEIIQTKGAKGAYRVSADGSPEAFSLS